MRQTWLIGHNSVSDFEASAQADASFRSSESNNASLPCLAEGRRFEFANRAFEQGFEFYGRAA